MAKTVIRDVFTNAEFSFELELDSIFEYIVSTEKFINNTSKNKITKFKKLEKKFNYESFYSDYYEEYLEKTIYEMIPPLFYSSLLSLYISVLESKLLELCQIAEKNTGIKMNTHYKSIEKYRKYLEEDIKVDFSIIDKQWTLLLKYKKLRNYLTHSKTEYIPSHESRYDTFIAFPFISFIQNDEDKFRFYIENSSFKTELSSIIYSIIDNLYFVTV